MELFDTEWHEHGCVWREVADVGAPGGESISEATWTAEWLLVAQLGRVALIWARPLSGQKRPWIRQRAMAELCHEQTPEAARIY